MLPVFSFGAQTPTGAAPEWCPYSLKEMLLMHAAMVLLVLLIGIVMLMFWRGLSCVQPLLYASLAVCTSLLWHWMFTALCGFGARPLLTVLSVAIAAGSFLRSSCVDFVIEAVSCGLWTAPFILIRNSRALSVSILSTSVVPCRLEGLSMIVLYCIRFLIVLAYVLSPFRYTKEKYHMQTDLMLDGFVLLSVCCQLFKKVLG